MKEAGLGVGLWAGAFLGSQAFLQLQSLQQRVAASPYCGPWELL